MKKIKEYLNQNLNELEVCSGANADVYILNQEHVLKSSFYRFDAFRYLAKLSLKKRNLFSFQPILEKLARKDDRLYLLKRLQPIDFDHDEIDDLFNMNINEGELLDGKECSERINIIRQLVANLVEVLNAEKNVRCFNLDLKKENVMQDQFGNIFLTDPVADINFEY